MKKHIKILGIETSCDDTGIAIFDNKKGLLINKTYSQKIHKKYGGIVPEIAARQHANTLPYMIHSIAKKKFLNYINAIAYTAGPGLFNSLIVGISFAKSLAYSLNIPSIAINHLEAHLLSPIIKHKKITFPFIGLLISGKHTQLILAKKIGKYTILGKSLDNSVGETFDKVAKLLGLKYPGGPKISNIAKYGKLGKYNFPKPMIKKNNLNFSFSGLQTHIKNLIKNTNKNKKNKYNIAKEFENTVIEILLYKSYQALKKTGLKKILISGGVSANKNLRKKFYNFFSKNNIKIFYTYKKLCTDNAGMIAFLGSIKYKKSTKKNFNIKAYPNLSIEKKIF